MGRDDVLPFWFGESDQPTPNFICEAAIASLLRAKPFIPRIWAGPTLTPGDRRLSARLHHVEIWADRIGVTGSGDSALMLTSQLLLSPGDRVVTVTPLWPNAVEIPKIMSAQVECVSLEVRDGRWQLPLERLLTALTPATRMLVLNSPNNPTGWTVSGGSKSPSLSIAAVWESGFSLMMSMSG